MDRLKQAIYIVNNFGSCPHGRGRQFCSPDCIGYSLRDEVGCEVVRLIQHARQIIVLEKMKDILDV